MLFGAELSFKLALHRTDNVGKCWKASVAENLLLNGLWVHRRVGMRVAGKLDRRIAAGLWLKKTEP